MGLFDKKYCDVCGDKIGLLGNRKLEDGNLCKNCAKKLSHWFNERRHSTVDDIKAQLAYREENKQKVTQFRKTRMEGDSWKILFDENNRWFTVTQSNNIDVNENPDIIDFSAVVGCNFSIDERKSEMHYKDDEGNIKSYNPPQYEYYYNFYIAINVNTPYFDEIKICLNSGSVVCAPMQNNLFSGFGQSRFAGGVNPEAYPEYCHYRDMGNEICSLFENIQKGTVNHMESAAFRQTPQATAAVSEANTNIWKCANCGTQNSGKFCEGCGIQRPVLQAVVCANCGWVPPTGQNKPKFCPECGTPFV